MNRRYKNNHACLRFRRWCRKAYAVFCSLGKCVTIGCLSKGIADASLRKQTIMISHTSFGGVYSQALSEVDVSLLEEEENTRFRGGAVRSFLEQPQVSCVRLLRVQLQVAQLWAFTPHKAKLRVYHNADVMNDCLR